ncbi:MAG: hypothetical protein ACRYG5_01930 [Janthinobacterium lividum]
MNQSFRNTSAPLTRQRVRLADQASYPTSCRRHIAMLVAITLAEMASPAMAEAAELPAAGTSIGTLATAQYFDANGDQLTTRSNLVETLITSVYAIEVDRGQTAQIRPGLAGDKVRFMHQVINLGNDDDGFSVSLKAADPQLQSIEIYPDSNGDGEPDPGSTPFTLKAGEPYRFSGKLAAQAHAYLVVEARSAAGTAADAKPAFKLVFASSKDPTKTVEVDDYKLITDSGAFDVWPSRPGAAVEPGKQVDTQFRARNLSRTQDGYVVVRFPLNALAPDFDYSKGSFKVLKQSFTEQTGSEHSATINGKPAGMQLDTASGTLTAWFYLLKAQTADIDFALQAKTDAPRGQTRSLMANYARARLAADGTPLLSNGMAQPDGEYLDSRPFEVTIRDTSEAKIAGKLVIAQALYGIEEEFHPTLVNHGSRSEIYSVQVDAGANFPVGTTFTALTDDGGAPLPIVDGMPSTGEVAAGKTLGFRIRVALPASTSAAALSQATATLRIRSRSGQLYESPLTIGKVEAAAVALSKDRELGAADSAPSSFSVDLHNPGESTAIELYVNNRNPAARSDRYRLNVASIDATVTAAFHRPVDGKCSAANLGAVVQQTAPIEQNRAEMVCLLVTPLNKQSRATLQITASSARTLASHVITGVLGNAARLVNLRSAQVGNVRPGGTVVYTHVLENAGWTTIPAGKLRVSASSSEKRWTTDVYLDPDQTGEPQPEQRLSAAHSLPVLEHGRPLSLLVQVTAAPDAVSRTRNLTTLDISDDHAQLLASIIDTTVVTGGTVTVVKEQAVDANCRSDAPATASFGKKTVAAKPGTCIWYRVVVTNPGDTAVSDLRIFDPIPSYARLQTSPVFESSGNVDGLVAHASESSVAASQPRLDVQQKSTLIYSVKIAE